MNNKDHHILSIGAAIIDQVDPDSIPTRIQFKPPAALGTNWWTAYGVESLPYITQIYPISGISPATSTQWATYLLFQLANPHNNNGVALSPAAPQVRLRVDGGIGLFTGGNGQTYASATDKQTSLFNGQLTNQSIDLLTGRHAAKRQSCAQLLRSLCRIRAEPAQAERIAVLESDGEVAIRLRVERGLTDKPRGQRCNTRPLA